MAAGFPTGGSPSKGQPQVQYPMGNYLAGRSYGGGGFGGGFGGWGYGPQSPNKKRGYQLARPGIRGGDSPEGGYGTGGMGGGMMYPQSPMMAGGAPMNMMASGPSPNVAPGAAPFQTYGQPPRRFTDFEGLSDPRMHIPEGVVQGQKGMNGVNFERLRGMSSAALGYRPNGLMGGAMSQGLSFGAAPDMLRRFLEARMGGGL